MYFWGCILAIEDCVSASLRFFFFSTPYYTGTLPVMVWLMEVMVFNRVRHASIRSYFLSVFNPRKAPR